MKRHSTLKIAAFVFLPYGSEGPNIKVHIANFLAFIEISESDL
jgi:hypothetical protein